MARALQARTRRARESQFGATEVIKRALQAPGNDLRVRMRARTVISARGRGKYNSTALLSRWRPRVVYKVLIFPPNQHISVLALSQD